MRRRYISQEERDNIIRLRKSGAGWLKIESMTGIPRRTAKRAFEENQQLQSEEEIRTARRQVAADLFESHIRDLVAIAEAISASLTDPDLRDSRYGELILDNILATRIRDKDMSSQVIGTEQTDVIRRQNRILFESLKQHTGSKIDWQTLDEWRTARNEWQSGIERLQSTSMTLVQNFLKQESNNSGPASRIGSDKKLVDLMVGGVVEAAYRAMMNGRLNDIENYINTREHKGMLLVLFGGSVSTTDMVVESKEVADRVVGICWQVVDNLAKGIESDILQGMTGSLQTIRGVRNVLVEKLDELMITPLILRTKCDICPA